MMDAEAYRVLTLILKESPHASPSLIKTLLASPDDDEPSCIVKAVLLALSAIPTLRPRECALDTDALYLEFLENQIPIDLFGRWAINILVETGFLRTEEMCGYQSQAEYVFTKTSDHPTHRLARLLLNRHDCEPVDGAPVESASSERTSQEHEAEHGNGCRGGRPSPRRPRLHAIG